MLTYSMCAVGDVGTGNKRYCTYIIRVRVCIQTCIHTYHALYPASSPAGYSFPTSISTESLCPGNPKKRRSSDSHQEENKKRETFAVPSK